MKKILLISHSEICYNARLLKAADYFHDHGWEVTVFNPIVGLASKKVYQSFIASRDWKVIENDISKRSFLSTVKWFLLSMVHRLITLMIDNLNIEWFHEYYLNKGLLFSPSMGRDYDVVQVHLIDNLPYAMRFKRKYGSKVIYDSQEYFVGQYAAFDPKHAKWVKENESRYMPMVDLLLTTTTVMQKRLQDDYQFKQPSFRVRNVPTLAQADFEYTLPNNSSINELKVVWHGMGIFLENRRGLHIILMAVARCKSDVKLFFQGNLNESQSKLLEQYIEKYELKGRVEVVPPANPDQIISSLKKYDVGVTGELPEEDNQRLTSSNKLFDYIHAGLAVISSDTAGLAETVNAYSVGSLYAPGDIDVLAKKLDELAVDKNLLNGYKAQSRKVAKELIWELEYEPIMQLL